MACLLCSVTITSADLRVWGLQGFPTLIFFQNGQMYRYSGQRTKDDLVQFATGKYQTVNGVPVPGNGCCCFDSIFDHI